MKSDYVTPTMILGLLALLGVVTAYHVLRRASSDARASGLPGL